MADAESQHRFEYRINDRWGVNVAYSYLGHGINWPYIAVLDKETFRDAWEMYGHKATTGIKFYPWADHKYFSLQLHLARVEHSKRKISYGTGDQSAYNYEIQEMFRSDFGLNLVFGLEHKSYRRYFGEWYFGLGARLTNTRKITHAVVNHGLVPDEYPIIRNYLGIMPGILVGYNIGMKTIKCKCRETRCCRFKNFPRNTVYVGFRYLSFERVLFRAYPFCMTAQIGLVKSMLNPSFQISNYFFYEIGAGITYWPEIQFRTLAWDDEYPLWLGKFFGLKFISPIGVGAKIELSKAWNNEFELKHGFVFDVGIGYSFGMTISD